MLYSSTVWGDDLSRALPFDAYRRGWRLYAYSLVSTVDPVCIRDRNQNILYEWYYNPSLTEVFEVCEKLAACV